MLVSHSPSSLIAPTIASDANDASQGRSTYLAVLMLAVVALVGQAYVINHLAGIDYPRWRANPA